LDIFFLKNQIIILYYEFQYYLLGDNMKEYSIINKLSFSALLITFLITPFEFPQQSHISEFQYLSPIPGSGMNQPETNIIIRYGTTYISEDIYNKDVLLVVGTKSGTHSGKTILTEDNKTLLFKPDVPFTEGENVNVTLMKQIRTEEDEIIPSLNFSFKITDKNLNALVKNNPEEYFSKINPEYFASTFSNSNFKKIVSPTYSVMDDSLPVDFPAILVDSINNPAPGYIFLSPFNYLNRGKNYIVILDNYGVPVFYRQLPYLNYDFKLQPTGVLTYYDELTHQFYVLDSKFKLIDSLSTRNGYLTDVHELRLLGHGHSLLMSYDAQHVNMDTIVPGGNPNALVLGLIVQELDENKNVVFQWRSWDHFNITDATYDINLTDSLIDYVHGNAIDVDTDGNLLISCRHMDEVTKINRQTGDIIWRWGGEHCENNQFTFINDPIGFSHQHFVRRQSNGNISVFDNGNLHSPQFSRAAEYQVDEVNKLAFLVWEYKNDPLTYSGAMGSVNRLDNHNTIIGWGTGVNPAISEVGPAGNVTLFLTLPDSLFNYRGYRFSWKTNLFVTSPDSLVFGYIPPGDSLEMTVEIINNSTQQIEINDTYNRDSVYQVSSTLPIILPAFGSDSITVKFKPESVDKDYFDDLHLRWNTEDQRIAQVVSLIGSTDPNFTLVENENTITDYLLSQNYPNPFNPTTTIRWRLAAESKVTLIVYDILGREVQTLINYEQPVGDHEVTFNASNLPSGIYFYTLRAGSFIQTKKMIFLK
jgi:Arylsulfotransferase (ASST)/Secretion system C-terminal sorting domain